MKYIESKLNMRVSDKNGCKAFIEDEYIDPFGKTIIQRRHPEFESAYTFDILLKRVSENEPQLKNICINYTGRLY